MNNLSGLLPLVLLVVTVNSVAQLRRPAVSRARAARLNSLGAAYMNQQKFERALGLFGQAAALDPGLEAAKTNAGIALLNLQRFEKARIALNEVVRAHADDAHAWYNLGLLHKSQGDSAKALDSFQ